MYQGGGASVARIYNPRPDPAEMGPPRRVNREETHIGERVASSKKRIVWSFTLGEADTIHSVTLVHSIMSYKKVVEFDGRQMHFSATATPGDWCFVMILDGTNAAMEVRINEMESADSPKYDLVIDRISFRRWDVYRRRKHGATPSNTYGQSSMSSTPAPTFGTQRWGPGGMSDPSPQQASSSSPAPPAHAYRGADPRASSFGRNSAPGYATNAPPPPQHQPQQRPAPAVQKKPQQEINLIGDFGPDISISAQQLLFDPLASSKMGGATPPGQTGTQPGSVSSTSATPSSMAMGNSSQRTSMTPFGSYPQAMQQSQQSQQPQQPQQPQQQQQQQQQQAYVDPFAQGDQPLTMRPTSTSINLDPFARQGSSYMQQNRAGAQASPPGGIATYPVYNPNTQQQPACAQEQAVRTQSIGSTGYSGAAGSAFPAQQPSTNKPAGAVNYSISHLMNPMEVNNVRNPQQTKTINIDPFANMMSK